MQSSKRSPSRNPLIADDNLEGENAELSDNNRDAQDDTQPILSDVKFIGMCYFPCAVLETFRSRLQYTMMCSAKARCIIPCVSLILAYWSV